MLTIGAIRAFVLNSAGVRGAVADDAVKRWRRRLKFGTLCFHVALFPFTARKIVP